MWLMLPPLLIKPLAISLSLKPADVCIHPKRIPGARIFENEPSDTTLSLAVMVP